MAVLLYPLRETTPHEERHFDPIEGMQDLGADKENARIRGDYTEDELREALTRMTWCADECLTIASAKPYLVTADVLRRVLGEETL